MMNTIGPRASTFSTPVTPAVRGQKTKFTPKSRPLAVVGMGQQVVTMATGATTSVGDSPDLELKAMRVRELEVAADIVHKEAQLLNKEGRFDEAQAKYAEMHKLEDEATKLAAEVGCVACVLGDPSCGLSESPDDPETAAAYFSTITLGPWPESRDGSTLEARVAGAVVGSLVADAAAQGVHWIYDLAQMQQIADERQAANPGSDDVGLEFLDPPRSPFYQYAVGRNSPYGEQTLVLLRSLAACKGLSCVEYAHAFAAYFGSSFDGYRDVSTKGFLRSYSRGLVPPLTGAPDAQANCIARAAPLVAAWAGQPQLALAVECATRVTQNSDAARGWALTGAGILEGVVLGQAPSAAVVQMIKELEDLSAVQTAQATNPVSSTDAHPITRRLVEADLRQEIALQLRRALSLAATPVPEAVAELGRNCHMPNALTTPLHIALHMEYLTRQAEEPGVGTSNTGGWGPECMGPDACWDEELSQKVGARFVQGVRAAIREGGCCASRAAYAGAVLGALASEEQIPSSWQHKYTAAGDVKQAVEAICAARRAGRGL